MDTTPDLDAYADRLGLDRAAFAVPPDLAQLARLQAAHLAAIPFENLEPRLGRPVSLALADLEDKLVRRRRGGYCFEQNSYLAAVLEALGFAVELLEARVRPQGVDVVLPRTHLVLSVDVTGARVLVDVGFGGDGPLVPVPFDGTPTNEPGGTYRLVPEPGGTLVLQRQAPTGWVDLYAIEPRPVLAVDLEVANHYTATYPSSVFARTLTVQRNDHGTRHILRARTYSFQAPGEAAVVQEGLDDGAVHSLLATQMGLDIDRDEVARALAGL